MKKILVFACASVFLLSSCKKNGAKPEVPVVPVVPPTTDNRFPVNLIVDSITLDLIRKESASNPDMSSAVTSIIMQSASSAFSKSPTPFIEGGSDNFSNISAQAQDCKMLALRWLYTFEKTPAEAKPFFDKVVATLLAWVNAGNKVASPVHTPNETSYFGFYESYSVVRNRMTAADRSKVDNWISARAFAYRSFAPRVNNWETIRLNLLYYFGYILNDKGLLDYTDNAYATLLNVNLMAGGKSEDVINRDAFAYHAYNLAFYARIFRVKAMYEGPAALSALKNRKNNINVSVQDMMDFWRPFLTDPANNVHIEFVNTKYAPDKTRADYNKPYDPASSMYALEELLLAFPETKGYITAIQPSATRYNRKVSGFLYWPK